MRSEIQNMKQELATISMMDEFARYARLERKINKMTDKLKTHGRYLLLSYSHFCSLSVSLFTSFMLIFSKTDCYEVHNTGYDSFKIPQACHKLVMSFCGQ